MELCCACHELNNTCDKLSDLQRQLLEYRLERELQSDYICANDRLKYFVLYSSKQRKCCNPFSNHKKSYTFLRKMREVSLDDVRAFENTVKLIPGEKICHSCFKQIQGKAQVLSKFKKNL